ncbi:hypothetical protein HZB01_04955 [Candidatus Woesearchaeota archaeon]|nr:hypothetical protein [Candidatus Woesearchaeota archaeon]
MVTMKAILNKQFWLWPIMDRRFIFVVAKSKEFIMLPKFGFYEKNGKTYFVAGFGKLHAGMRIVSKV